MRYRVWMHTKPAMCRTFYDGKVDVWADDEDGAVQEAVRRAAQVHGHRDFAVDRIEVLETCKGPSTSGPRLDGDGRQLY